MCLLQSAGTRSPSSFDSCELFKVHSYAFRASAEFVQRFCNFGVKKSFSTRDIATGILLDSIPVTREVNIAKKHGGGVKVVADIKGLRDRAVIAIMAYTFARISAVAGLKRGDYRPEGKRAVAHAGERRQGEARLAASLGGAVSGCIFGGSSD